MMFRYLFLTQQFSIFIPFFFPFSSVKILFLLRILFLSHPFFTFPSPRVVWHFRCLDDTSTHTPPMLQFDLYGYPSDILSHATIYFCYTLSPLWYVQGFNIHQGKKREVLLHMLGHPPFFLPGGKWYVHLTLRPPIRYVQGFNIHQGKMGTFCRIC